MTPTTVGAIVRARWDGCGASAGWRRRAAVIVATVAIALLWSAYLFSRLSGFEYRVGETLYIVVAVPTVAVVGAVLAVRSAGNRIAWLLLALALLFGAGIFAAAYAQVGLDRPRPTPLAAVAPWVSRLSITLVAIPLVTFFIWFPDGRSTRPGWEHVLRLWVPLHVAGSLLRMVDPAGPTGLDGQPLPVVSPFQHGAFETAAHMGRVVTTPPVFALVLAAAVVALLDRVRTAESGQRRQIAWVAFSAVPFGLVFAAGEIVDGAIAEVLWAVAGVLATAVPLTIGVAVLRYRLYEIERVISRTVSYGLVVAVLGAVYVAGVVGLGAAASGLTGQEDSDLAVAASVLVVVALFRPVRSRVQAAVDRRFNRTGYQARLAVEAFCDGLGDEVHLAELRDGIATTAAATVQPTSASLWLAGATQVEGP